MNRLLFYSICIFLIAVISISVGGAVWLLHNPQPTNYNQTVPDNITVYFFYGNECLHCHEIMPFINETIVKYPSVKFNVFETWHNETNWALVNTMNRDRNITLTIVPEIIIGDDVMFGDETISENLDRKLSDLITRV